MTNAIKFLFGSGLSSLLEIGFIEKAPFLLSNFPSFRFVII